MTSVISNFIIVYNLHLQQNLYSFSCQLNEMINSYKKIFLSSLGGGINISICRVVGSSSHVEVVM